jgi:chemotaxis protein MotB
MSPPKHMNIDRFNGDFTIPKSAWIVSYADIVTIILTFFILLLSISTIAQTKYELVVQAFTGEKAGNLMDVQEQIKEVIEEQGLAGEVETRLELDGLKVSFSNALLFNSGDADLREQAHAALKPIRDHLVQSLGDRYGMIIEGYTDDVPISNARFRSNWELSTSRAISVKDLLVEGGLDARRISVQGFADTRPASEVDLTSEAEKVALTPEALEEARSKSRRVVLRIDALNPQLLKRVMERGGWRESGAPTSPRAAPEGVSAPSPFEPIAPAAPTAHAEPAAPATPATPAEPSPQAEPEAAPVKHTPTPAQRSAKGAQPR